MKIVLLEDIEKLGTAGSVVSVKDGYARNYLIPRKKALPATPQNLKYFEEKKKIQNLKQTQALKNAQLLANRLSKLSLTATVQVGEEDKVFGAVTSATIADLIKEKGIEIDKKQIMLEEPIKALGIYTVPIRLHPEVNCEVKVWVIKG